MSLVTSSQGEISSLDKQLHYIDLSKKGTVQICVYDTSGGNRTLLDQKTFRVDTFVMSNKEKALNKLSDKCQLSIEDFSGPNIPLSVIKKASRFKVKSPYIIKSLVVYIGKDVP